MDEAGLNECIIKDAARLIVPEIRNMPYSTDHYPLPSDMLDASVPVVPSLLQLLLKSLVRSELKQTAISQSIIQACRPNFCIMPILFSLCAQLDFQFGSEVLLQELSRLGFCVSYDEITCTCKWKALHPTVWSTVGRVVIGPRHRTDTHEVGQESWWPNKGTWNARNCSPCLDHYDELVFYRRLCHD